MDSGVAFPLLALYGILQNQRGEEQAALNSQTRSTYQGQKRGS